MQPKINLKRSLLASAVLMSISNASLAGTANFNVTASAIQDVTITAVQNLSFGNRVYITTGGVCNLDALVPSEAQIQANSVTGAGLTNAAGSNFGGVSGTGCVDGAATAANAQTAGVYKITGEPGANVSITVNSTGTAADPFTYAPGLGCYIDYSGTAGDVDACNFFGGSATGVTLADATEGGDAGVESGESVFSVGGTLTIENGGADLDPNQAYTANFDIVVVYE